jgi:hypothetical protein
MSKKIEEAAERLFPDKMGLYEVFLLGAKTQAETMYSYDELRRIAYNAYCFGQFEEPTEGKFNKWIVEFKKETT